jgi:hypothetical protein
MSVVMIIVEAAAGFEVDFAGNYLEAFDPYFPDPTGKGLGLMLTTPDIKAAKRFPSILEAAEYWKQQSPVVPFRDDGLPNRPLTAFTVTFKNIDGIDE